MGSQSKIRLPWTRQGAVLVAEFGAVFSVEQVAEGWQCSVQNGDCVEVLDTGLKSQRQGKARAEQHATRMAAEALAENKPSSGRGRGRPPRADKPESKPRASRARPAPAGPEPSALPEPKKDATPAAAPAITFEPVEDGCLTGRAGGACWVANEREVVFTRDVDPEVQAAVEQTAARYYGEKREAAKAEREQQRANAKAQRDAEKAEREKARAAKKAAAKKRTAKKAAAKRATAKAPEAPAKPAAKKTAAKKTAAKKTAKTAAKKTAKRAPRGRRGKAAAQDAPEGEPVTKAKETPAKGAVTWGKKDGELRGTAAHGTFLIQSEGARFALYFYEPGGQSRYLTSGDTPCAMRKAAEEMAARGQPAPERETLSADKEEALLRMFASGAVGGS